MAEWMSGGHLVNLVDLVVALTLLECVALVGYHRLTRRGVAPKDYALNLASGLCLMFALRCALVTADWQWVALWLTAAGLAHGADIISRWKR